MVLRHPHPIPKEVGEIAVSKYKWCNGVFQQLGTSGENRRPILRHLAGTAKTEVIHKENGVKYILDIAKVTFSGGNSELRRRLAKEVEKGERLLDMFAAVGNLSMQPIVHKNVEYILVEKDPITYSYLIKTLEANGKSAIHAHNMDCRDITIKDWADRIFMGFHGVDESHLRVALKALGKEGKIHIHPIGKPRKKKELISEYISIIKKQNVDIKNTKIMKVKKYSPGLLHYEIIFEIAKV